MTKDNGSIRAIELFPLRVPLKCKTRLSGRYVAEVDLLYIRLCTNSGAEGWGEVIVDLDTTGETVSDMVAFFDRIRPWICGRSVFDWPALMDSLAKMAPNSPGARSALEMSLVDVVGRLRGITAAALLGGANRQMVRVLAIVPADTQENALTALHEAKARGITAFKLKVGSPHVDDDIEILRQVRKHAGDDCFLAADANMVWDVETACRYEHAARDLNLGYLEQPVADDLEALTQLGQWCKVPISADESVHDADSIASLARTGVAGISLKACKLGGLAGLVATSSAASAVGLRVGHAMMMESGLSTAAALHAACTSHKLEWHLNIGVDFLATDPADVNLQWVADSIRLPEAIGLGVNIEMKAILAFKK